MPSSFFDSIFDVFSKRSQEMNSGDARPKPLTPEFKTRVAQVCTDTFPIGSGGLSSPRSPIWSEVYRRMKYQHGSGRLSERYTPGYELTSLEPSALEDLQFFLEECDDEHFLDFIEHICNSESFPNEHEKKFVNAINKFFHVDDLPYALTPFQREERREQFHGKERTVHALIAKPKVIRRDSQVTHEKAIEPTLQLLTDQRFSSANAEFLEALEDFRHDDYRDCVTKCCSAMESVMKIICDRRGWPYSQEDSAGKLVNTIIANSSLDGFFDQPIMLVATIRNRLSSAHGAGTEQRNVPEHLARYAINATAANILLMVDECT